MERVGVFRKLTSLSTGGIVDFRSDKERTAFYGRQSRNELRKQNALLRSQLAQPAHMSPAAAETTAPAGPAAVPIHPSNIVGADAPLQERVRSLDPEVKAAAIAEWRAINRAANS